jgi:antitoxin YefM
MTAITASEARKRLFSLLDQVNEDHTPVEILHSRADAVLVSKADWDAMEETAYLLRSPANAAWLAAGMEELRDRDGVEGDPARS